jgi:THO complex subunit 2
MELEVLNLNEKQKHQWTLFCKEIIKKLRLNMGLLMERLEPEHLEELSLVTSAGNFNKKMIRMNTGLLYKQQKYNLVWEENEGYSKLVVDLMSAALSRVSVEQALSMIYSIIGYFDLDPNRALDVVLECFEHLPDYKEFFVELLKSLNFNRSTLCDILGSKFSGYYRNKILMETPKSLCTLAAILIQSGLVTLVNLYTHVSLTKGLAHGIR